MNIFAYTETKYNCYPAYVSLNYRDGKTVLTTRSPDNNGVLCGSCELSDEKLLELASAIQLYLTEKKA